MGSRMATRTPRGMLRGLRLHPALPYYVNRVLAGTFPAMLARVVAPDGRGATLHRTYLQGGHKAPVTAPKKLMAGKPVAGAAVRLFPVAECLGIAEGIETALAAAQIFDVPVWSCISAAGIQSFERPAGVRQLIVFGDNDPNFAGQTAAGVHGSVSAKEKRLGRHGEDSVNGR